MKFKDLRFNSREVWSSPEEFEGMATEAVAELSSGVTLFVNGGAMACCGEGTFEVYATKGGEGFTDSPFSEDDVLGFQTPDDIDAILEKLEKLK